MNGRLNKLNESIKDENDDLDDSVLKCEPHYFDDLYTVKSTRDAFSKNNDFDEWCNDMDINNTDQE